MPTPGNPMTSVRLDDEVRTAADRIQSHFALPSLAGAIRYAILRTAEQVPERPQPAGKKSPKKSKKGA